MNTSTYISCLLPSLDRQLFGHLSMQASQPGVSGSPFVGAGTYAGPALERVRWAITSVVSAFKRSTHAFSPAGLPCGRILV